MKKVLVTLFLVGLLFIGAHISAFATTPGEVLVSIWPEQDDNQIMLVERATFPDETPLPIQVVLPAPAGSNVQWAGEIMGSDTSKDVGATPSVNSLPDHEEVNFTLTKSRVGQIEVRWSGLRKSGQKRTIDLFWKQYYESKSVVFQFRRPSKISDLKLSAPFPPAVVKSTKEYITAIPQAYSLGQEQRVTITYNRSTDEPTVNDKVATKNNPAQSSSFFDGSARSNLLILLILVAAAVASFMVYLIVFR